jgi:hypothetical protein
VSAEKVTPFDARFVERALATFDRRTSAAKVTPVDARFVERALAAFDRRTSAAKVTPFDARLSKGPWPLSTGELVR